MIKSVTKKKIYECKPCNYITPNKSFFNRHLKTDKHQSNLNTIPSHEDLNLLDEKRQSLLISPSSLDCSKCHTSNVSSYHLSSGKFCAIKIKYANDLIHHYHQRLGELSIDDLLQEFHSVSTIKAFALAFQNKYILLPLPYDKQPNGKRPTDRIGGRKGKQKPTGQTKEDEKTPIRYSPDLLGSSSSELVKKFEEVSSSRSYILRSGTVKKAPPTVKKAPPTVKKSVINPGTAKEIHHTVYTPLKDLDNSSDDSSSSEDEPVFKFSRQATAPSRLGYKRSSHRE